MKKILSLVVSLTAISGICAAVLAYVNEITKDPIAEMKVKKEQGAVKAVLPNGAVKVEEKGGFYVGTDAAGKVVGYAAKGMDAGGYGGDIVLMRQGRLVAFGEEGRRRDRGHYRRDDNVACGV